MIIPIKPVLVARNTEATAITAQTILDDQATQALWFVGYGTVDADGNYTAIPNQSTNLTMDGAAYTAWTGSPAEAAKWLLSQLNLEPAAES